MLKDRPFAPDGEGAKMRGFHWAESFVSFLANRRSAAARIRALPNAKKAPHLEHFDQAS
jgi:hypothetical protein